MKVKVDEGLGSGFGVQGLVKLIEVAVGGPAAQNPGEDVEGRRDADQGKCCRISGLKRKIELGEPGERPRTKVQ